MIYLDGNATTPCDPRVLNKMIPYFTQYYGNPSSEIHEAGRIARKAVELARKQIADFITVKPEEIIFTGGATESNNLAILGIAKAFRHGNRKRIITTTIEHKSVLEPCRYLQNLGFELISAPVDPTGRIIEEEITKYLNKGTILLSIQLANNEIGTIQDVKKITMYAKKQGVFVHCDAAQAVGKIDIDTDNLFVDFLSLSAHKMYGPKGIGALYIRGGASSFPLIPLIYGGSQEWGIRPGTLNVPAIVGFGEAAKIASEDMKMESKRLAQIRDDFEKEMLSLIPALKINGNLENRLPGTTSLTFPSADAEQIISNARELSISSGSACSSGLNDASHVLKAIGLSNEEAFSTIRVTAGRFNSKEEMNQAVHVLLRVFNRIKSL